MPELQTLTSGLVFGESPRWHDGRLWFSDMGTNEVAALDLEGTSEVVAHVPAMPMGADPGSCEQWSKRPVSTRLAVGMPSLGA